MESAYLGHVRSKDLVPINDAFPIMKMTVDSVKLKLDQISGCPN